MYVESTAQILFTVSAVSFVLAGICLALAVIFFIRFKIPSVIRDLTGKRIQSNSISDNRGIKITILEEVVLVHTDEKIL